MKLAKNLILCGLLTIAFSVSQSAFATTDYIFFSVNGDTTLSTMTQGDEFAWGSNCDVGATINWEIWYDVNSNSIIDLSSDVLINSEIIGDGNLLYNETPPADGWVMSSPFNLSLEPGIYIFKATDIVSAATVQKTVTMVAMTSPPNQFTGQITLPGISAPNSLLANRLIFAEPDTADIGIFGGFTDNMGQFAINLGATGTDVEFYLSTSEVHNFVKPDDLTAIASGVVANNDFVYTAAVDSVWGFVKDETGTMLPIETNVSAGSDNTYKYVGTENGRYVMYFSNDDKGIWRLSLDSRISPIFLSPEQFEFSHDTLTSFQYDLTVTWTDSAVYAIITENGALPVNNYRVDAYSSTLGSSSESISGINSDNIVRIGVSTLDNSDWSVQIATWDDQYQIPTDLILPIGSEYIGSVSPGDTVEFNLVTGNMVSGTITQDAGDTPVIWNDVMVGSYPYQTNAGGGGAYTIYSDTGTYNISVYADGYISDPAFREVAIIGDTSGAGLNFVLNQSHCNVTGTLTTLQLPLDGSYYQVFAYTGTLGLYGADGYFVAVNVDSLTGTYNMNLCDGDWTIIPPNGFADFDAPAPTVVTIGEAPDISRTIDFDYSLISDIGDDINGNLPLSFELKQNYPNPFNPATTIGYSLPVSSFVTIDIFNLLGQKINSLIDESKPAGYYEVNWGGIDFSGNQVSTGYYFYRINAGDYNQTRKMLLLK